jgi:hypothetical protein
MKSFVAILLAWLLLAAAPQANLSVTVQAANANYAAGQTDTFGGCQIFPTNDLVNLDIYGVPVDSTSADQIANAYSHTSASFESA